MCICRLAADTASFSNWALQLLFITPRITSNSDGDFETYQQQGNT